MRFSKNFLASACLVAASNATDEQPFDKENCMGENSNCNNESIFGNLWQEQSTRASELAIEVENVDSEDELDDTSRSPENDEDCSCRDELEDDQDNQVCEGFLCNLWPATRAAVQDFDSESEGHYCMADECGVNASGECCDGLWCKLWSLNYCDGDDYTSDHQEVIDTFLQSTDHDYVDVDVEEEEKDDKEEDDDEDDFAEYDDEEDDGEDEDDGKSLWCQLWPAQCAQPDTATRNTDGDKPAPANSFSKL